MPAWWIPKPSGKISFICLFLERCTWQENEGGEDGQDAPQPVTLPSSTHAGTGPEVTVTGAAGELLGAR